jgi:hypothetical protein
MPILNSYNYISFIDSVGKKHEFGSLNVAKQQTISGFHEDKNFNIGTSATVKVFDIDESPLADFQMLAVEVDYDCMMEIVVDDDANVGEVASTIGLLGSGTTGIAGPALVIHRDEAYANYAVNFASGTLDVIETIRIKNLSGSQAVQAHILLVT